MFAASTATVNTLPLPAVTVLVLLYAWVRRPSRRLKELCYSGLIFVWLIMFPMVCNKIFETMDGCEAVDEGESYMKIDLRIDCDSGEGLVHRAICKAEAMNAGSVAEDLVDGLAEYQGTVFAGVVTVDIEVATEDDARNTIRYFKVLVAEAKA